MRVLAGDAREMLRDFDEECTVITDPPWPDCDVVDGSDDVAELLRTTLAHIRRARRVVIVFGCDSDPRVLTGVDQRWPFVRTCNLRYNIPSYAGTILRSGDVAYVFGDSRPTKMKRASPLARGVLPGECTSLNNTKLAREGGGWHPCPRRLTHALWLVKWFSDPGELVVDPFAGSGTTGVACARLGRPFLGVELREDWAEQIRHRLELEARGSSAEDEAVGQATLFAERTP